MFAKENIQRFGEIHSDLLLYFFGGLGTADTATRILTLDESDLKILCPVFEELFIPRRACDPELGADTLKHVCRAPASCLHTPAMLDTHSHAPTTIRKPTPPHGVVIHSAQALDTLARKISADAAQAPGLDAELWFHSVCFWADRDKPTASENPTNSRVKQAV